MADENALREALKRLIVDTLNLEGVEPASIGDEQALFGSGLGLDSVDALELMVAVEKEFGMRIEIGEVDRSAFGSVAALARMVAGNLRPAQPTGS